MIWDEKKYEEAMAKGARASLKRNVNDVEAKKDYYATKVIVLDKATPSVEELLDDVE